MLAGIGSSLSGASMVQALSQMQKQMQSLQVSTPDPAKAQEEMLSSAGFSVQGTTPAVQDNGLIEGPTANDSVGEFAAMLSRAFENVNILQNESSSMQSRFDVGDRSVSLADVMLASQKSSISFEATLQVRNKMVDAYKTIMQMQI